jgi:5-methylcytosine-specific restriction endonuclease McrA
MPSLNRDRSHAWARVRRAVLARDGHRCQLRIHPICTTIATHVHHTIGLTTGNNPTHLIAACEPCNLRVGKPDAEDQPPRRTTRW